MNSVKLIAIDPSLSCSGWAVFNSNSHELLNVGIIKPPGPELSLAKRLDFLQLEVSKLFSSLKLKPNDILVCEGAAPLVKNPLSSQKVEQVRGIFEAVARVFGLNVPGRINPRTVQTELLGLKGKQIPRNEVKLSAVQVVKSILGNRYQILSEEFNSKLPQDIVDAFLIGQIALSRITLANNTNTELYSLFNSKNIAKRGRSSARWSEKDFKKLAK